MTEGRAQWQSGGCKARPSGWRNRTRARPNGRIGAGLCGGGLVLLLAATLALAGCGQNARVQAKGQSVTSIGVGSR